MERERRLLAFFALPAAANTGVPDDDLLRQTRVEVERDVTAVRVPQVDGKLAGSWRQSDVDDSTRGQTALDVLLVR